MVIEVYVLRDQNGSACDFYFHLFPSKKVNLNLSLLFYMNGLKKVIFGIFHYCHELSCSIGTKNCSYMGGNS